MSQHESPFIQHHYDNAKHQFDSGKLGMWFFLAQEVLFFSALFVAYIIYRANHPEIYAYAHHYLDTTMGAINTAVLLCSSLTAAWAVRAAQLNQKRLLSGLLAATILCALGFLGIKYVEYSHKFHEGLLFGSRFDPCIAPSGKHLLTKSNYCPGTKSSVIYDFAKKAPAVGCIEGYLDQKPEVPGVQASCSVTERLVTFRTGAQGKTEKVEESKRKIDACADNGHVAPCWELAAHPDICPTNADGSYQPAALVWYGDHLARGPKVQIEASCSKAEAPKPSADPFATVAETQPQLGVGLVAAAPAAADGHGVGHAKMGGGKDDGKGTGGGHGDGTGAGDGSGRTAAAHATGHGAGHGNTPAFIDGPPPPNTAMFFSIYFAMTGLHGIHVLVGVFVFLWLLFRAMAGHFGPSYFGPVDNAALYWHLVDLIWIFLFPLMYLIH